MRTRQQEITRQQVVCKLDEAERRLSKYMQEMTKEDISRADWEGAFNGMLKAANDYETWRTVLASL